MVHIAILVPVCSRNKTVETLEGCPLLQYLIPSFLRTCDDSAQYTFFIGFDDDDAFYTAHADDLRAMHYNVFALSGCQHAPAFAWNQLAALAYNSESHYDYFFQVGDDVVLETPGWTQRFIEKLQGNSNVGVVGPCNPVNYAQRKKQNLQVVIENAFVHRTHISIFGTFFHPSIRNWYCDNWMTCIYEPYLSEMQMDILCKNSIIDARYIPERVKDIAAYVKEARTTLVKYFNVNFPVTNSCVVGKTM